MPIPDTAKFPSDAPDSGDAPPVIDPNNPFGKPEPFALQPSPPAAKKRGRQVDTDPVRLAYARVINDLRFLTGAERARVVRAVLSILDIDLA